jgi:hypothetical protein
MAKQRGYPDRRGMGSESDLISETFAPNEQYKAQQKLMEQTFRIAGLSPEQIASMLCAPVDVSPCEKPEDPKVDAAAKLRKNAPLPPDESKPKSHPRTSESGR